MQRLLLFLQLLVSTSVIAQNTKVPQHPISAADSARVKDYWQKANHSRLFSQQRQLYLDSALAITPWRAYFWQQKSMPLSKQMKHDLAKPYLDSAVKYDPAAYLPYRGFLRCIFSRDYIDALQDFYASKKVNGNSGVMDHPYDFYIGLCHLQLNHFDSARYYIHKCIEEKRRTAGADWVHYLHWFYEGITWFEQEHYNKAITCFDSSLRLNPYLPEDYYYTGICLARKGDKRTALDYVTKADSLIKRGYFINEDNARYETYPYQVRTFFLQGMLDWLEEGAN